jgi:hypothetical protein
MREPTRQTDGEGRRWSTNERQSSAGPAGVVARQVHEAYLRLTGEQSFESRSHFMRAAAEAMRRILVDHAREMMM